jgi:valyl-tRNA synthetase
MIIEPRYQPQKTEDKIYNFWEETGFFNPDNLPGKRKKVFSIIMPPPNANGSLHIGHAVFVSLQDLMIRYYRMKGFKTLWLPGADHAGFETQVVFDKKLEKEGKSRFQMNRKELYEEILKFTLANKKIMEKQLRKLGASCDWSREKFTLDPDIVSKTQDTFIKLYEDGLIYRGKRIVNWCPKHQTALSDLEVKYIEKKDPLYYIKYGPLVLATVRPETKFGDTALAVHPQDKRYQKYIGKTIEVETLLGKTQLKVIADSLVDPNFGTGVVKITPAHDPIDFEIGLKHNLEIKEVIDQFGRLNEKTGPYAGLKVKEAREKVVADLKAKNLIEKIDENYAHKIAVCYKCGSPIEPRMMAQWFVKMKPLAEKAIKVVKENKISFIPERFKKIYFHWLKNIKDWNISRQIVWGIRIPAWFCKNCEKFTIAKEKPLFCQYCQGKNLIQEPDVFDTWFSSSQWPFLTLGFPKSQDYKTFYPTTVMETAWDILFFWVARMIILGLYVTKKVPFKIVYLHGLVRDKDRQKMSKSKGNVIDPLGVIDLYGADALRMALIVGNKPGNDPIIHEEKIKGYRNFANKIWNVSRFVLMNLNDFNPQEKVKMGPKEQKDLKQFNALIKKVTKLMDSFRFYLAAEILYHYFWHTFADKILEENKEKLKGPQRKASQKLLLVILKESLKMLHPFMPFLTEEIYQKLPGPKLKSIMIEAWPKPNLK